MLFRRISKHVKDQNWFAVAIDFFIVVFGVFVGLQVQNWSAEQNNRELERHYLMRLVEDVDASITGNKLTLQFIESNQANAWVVQQSVAACNIPNDKQVQFVQGLYQIGRFLPVSYDLGTVNEMQSAGNFSILRNPDVRTRLNKMVSDSREYSEILLPISTRLGPQFSPIDRHIVLNIEHIRPWSAVPETHELEFDLKSMCEDEEFLPALSMVRSINQFHIDRFLLALETLTETRAVLRAELGLEPEEEEATP